MQEALLPVQLLPVQRQAGAARRLQRQRLLLGQELLLLGQEQQQALQAATLAGEWCAWATPWALQWPLC